jgi:hypothetical protein
MHKVPNAFPLSPTPLMRAHSGCHGNEPRPSHSLISQKLALTAKDGVAISQFKPMTTVWHLHKKFWEELTSYFPLKRHWPHGKRPLQQFFVAAGKCIQTRCLATIWDTQTAPQTLLWWNIDRIQKTRPTILLLLRVFVAVGTCLPSRCLALKGGLKLTEPLPSNDRRDTHIDTRTEGRDLWSTPLRCARLPWYTKFHK